METVINMKTKESIISPLLILILLYSLSVSCQTKNEIINADLTFRSISFMSAYGASEEEYKDLMQEIDKALNNESNRNEEEIKLLKYFDKLRKFNLLKKPYIFLLLKDNSIITVYLSEKEYEKVKGIKHVDLFEEGKKVVVELELQRIDKDIYFSNNIIKVEKIEGRSHSDK